MALFDFLREAPQRVGSALFGGFEATPGEARSINVLEPDQGLIGRDQQTPPGPELPPEITPINPAARRMGAPIELTAPPTMKQDKGFLSDVWDFAKRPETLIAVATALRSAGGNENAFEDQARIMNARRQDQLTQQQKEDRRRKNEAFKGAYKDGRFNPQAYLDALEGVDVDVTDVADLAKAFAPEGGVEGGVAYLKDPFSGEITWRDAKPLSPKEEQDLEIASQKLGLDKERLREMIRHNRATEGIGQSNASRGWAAHNARVAAGGYGTPGVGVGPVADDDVEVDQ